MDSFTDGYNNFIRSSSGIGAIQGSQYVSTVEKAIQKLTQDINDFQGFSTKADILKGNVAEFWHSGTHNIDAAVKDSNARTWVLKSNKYASVDIGSNWGENHSLKFYKNGAKSAEAQSISHYQRYMKHINKGSSEESFDEFTTKRTNSEQSIHPHDAILQNQVRIVPKDQLEEAVAHLKEGIAEESVKRPELARKYQETLDRLTDRIRSPEGTESIAITDAEAKILAELGIKGLFDPSQYGLTTEELIKFKYILQQSWKAGCTAATISAALRVAPAIYKAIVTLISTGELDEDDFKKIGFAALTGSAEGFIRGNIAAALTVTCQAGLLGSTAKAIDPSIIGAVTVICINAIQNSYKVATNQMTKAEFTDICMRDLFVSTCSIALGSTTQGFISIPVFGYMVGSFVGSISAAFIYEVGHTSVLSFCIESGFTFLGIVEQNYTLPQDVLEALGIECFEYEKFEYEKFCVVKPELLTFNLKSPSIHSIDISFLRRGVIGVNKIGYV